MKKVFAIIFLLVLPVCIFSQVIEGTVFDKSTKEPVSFASVYYSGTSNGTLSGADGKFRIDISGYRTMPLTVSAIGYYSATITDFSGSKILSVYLVQKPFELDEVVVNARSTARERKTNMAVFRNEFVGTTVNAMSCEILNEKDIRFRSSENGDTLRAFATNPIKILNRALGYEITYFLDNFEYHRESKTFFYKGNILFKPDTALGSAEYKSIERKRRFAYLGSRMHFFRSLWVDDLSANGFGMITLSNKKILYNNIVFQKDSHSKVLRFSEKLGVTYYTPEPTSFIEFLRNTVYFDANGYYDASAVLWEGEMAMQRIADTLPYDYVLNE